MHRDNVFLQCHNFIYICKIYTLKVWILQLKLLFPPAVRSTNDLSISISTHHPFCFKACQFKSLNCKRRQSIICHPLQSLSSRKSLACLKCSFGGWGDAMLIEVKTKTSLWSNRSNLLELINLPQINLTSLQSTLQLLWFACFSNPETPFSAKSLSPFFYFVFLSTPIFIYTLSPS